MLPTKISVVTLMVIVVCISLICLSPVEARATFVSSSRTSFLSSQDRVFFTRGGAAAVAEEDSDFEIESSDYDEDEEDDLVKSATSSISKVAKKAVGSALASTKPQKKKSSVAKLFKMPYIVGACLNPFTMLSMIKGYWASLVDLNYLKENVDSSENLRSALQEKAKKGGGSSGNRGKRKMKPGQAKTLSDLPQLNT